MADWTSNPGHEPGDKKSGSFSGLFATRFGKVPAQDAKVATLSHAGWRNLSGLHLQVQEEIPVVCAPEKTIETAIKRAVDIIFSLLALLFFAPFLLAVALAVKLTSPGPILFRQTREGINGSTFEIYKFRTMYAHACDPTGIKQTESNDTRITPLGASMRRTSIDELPQLINVLKGDMSLVGPRPHAVGMLAAGRQYSELVPYYHQRLLIKPGLTGWAQANGLRGPTVNADAAIARIDHDLAYIANYSIWLDIKIIAMTLRHELFGGNGF